MRKGGEDFCPAHLNPKRAAAQFPLGKLKKAAARQMRRPPDRFVQEGWDAEPLSRIMEEFDVTQPTASRWRQWVEYQEALREAGEFQEKHGRVFLGGLDDLPKNHWEWGEEHIDTLVDGFLEFRPKYFQDRGKQYTTPPHQERWARSIFRVLVLGERSVILAPVRHGKTELLTQICIFLWMLDPNIRVLWVSATTKIAKKPVAKMRAVLMQNERLIKDFAPEGTFVPPLRDPRSWGSEEFTLATRTDFNVSGPNVLAFGRDGTILSMNADIIIVDDIESKGSVTQKAIRDETKEWWVTQLGSRIEEHTGLFVIGSRQHPDDLYGTLIADPGWDVHVEKAHDPACDIREEKEHVDCMLWPEYRSHKWLMAQKREADKYSPTYFDMAYQNVSRSEGIVVFPEEVVRGCVSLDYAAGSLPKRPKESGALELVAGLDPAISGFQAAVLLAYQTEPELRIWLVDLENTLGGGVGAAATLMDKWSEKYGVHYWVVEENLLGQVEKYQEIRAVKARRGLMVQNWRTDRNKNSQHYGVTSLATLFNEKIMVLPYATPESRDLSDKLILQLSGWDESNSRSKSRSGMKDDLVMALWFAWDPIRRARQDYNTERGADYGGYDATDFDVAPWDTLDYAV